VTEMPRASAHQLSTRSSRHRCCSAARYQLTHLQLQTAECSSRPQVLGGLMKVRDPLLPSAKKIPEVRSNAPIDKSARVIATRDHQIVQQWASDRHAEPATGEATSSGPATLDIRDGGSGIRFNFPGSGRLRPISWEEWFENFDGHGLIFVYDNDADEGPTNRYRIVKVSDWGGVLE